MRWWVLPALCGLLFLFQPPVAGDEPPATKYTLRVFRLWAVKKDRDQAPKLLQPYLRQLKKSSKHNVFTLAGKVVSQDVRAGQKVEVPLPQGYRGIWRVKSGAKGPRLIQRLVNPKKKKSDPVLIKKNPGISTLARVKDARKGVLVLLVDFAPAKAKKK